MHIAVPQIRTYVRISDRSKLLDTKNNLKKKKSEDSVRIMK